MLASRLALQDPATNFMDIPAAPRRYLHRIAPAVLAHSRAFGTTHASINRVSPCTSSTTIRELIENSSPYPTDDSTLAFPHSSLFTSALTGYDALPNSQDIAQPRPRPTRTPVPHRIPPPYPHPRPSPAPRGSPTPCSSIPRSPPLTPGSAAHTPAARRSRDGACPGRGRGRERRETESGVEWGTRAAGWLGWGMWVRVGAGLGERGEEASGEDG